MSSPPFSLAKLREALALQLSLAMANGAAPSPGSSSHLKERCEMQAGSGRRKHITELVRRFFPLSPLPLLKGNFCAQQSEENVLKISSFAEQSIWQEGETTQGLEQPEEV